MASVFRRPFVVTATLRQTCAAAKPTQTTVRLFHQTPLKQQISSSKKTFTQSRPLVSQYKNALQSTFRRNYTPQGGAISTGSGSTTQRLIYGAGIFGGTLVAINLIFNRETREDGGMPPFERSYLNETFMVRILDD